MPLSFPSSPSLNQTYTFGTKTWIWNGTAWSLLSEGAINGIPIGNVVGSTGNFSAITVSGNATAGYFIGNGYYLTGTGATNISNGNTNIRILGANGNIYSNVGGTANVFSITTLGINVAGDTTISGNLIVGGNVSNVNVTNLNIQDPLIGIGRGANNAPLTTNDGKDRGEQLWYYSSSEKSAFIGYINSTGNLIAATDVSISSELVTVNNYGNFVVGGVIASSVDSTGNIVGGNINTSGQVVATGNITGNYYIGNGSQLTGLASLSTVYYQLQVQGNVTGNAAGNITLTASNSSGILYPQAGNGITMTGNSATGVLTITVTGSTNDGTFWANNEDCGLVTGSLDAPSVDNGSVADSVTSAYDLGAMDFAANYSSIASDILPATTNTYIIGNSTLSWKSIYADGNITTANGYFIGNGSLLTGVVTAGGTGTLSNGTSSIAIATANGNATVSIAGNSNVVVFSSGVTTYNANIVPAANATYNLGSASLQWNSLYVAGNTIYLGNITLKAGAGNSLGVYGADGTTGGGVLNPSGYSYNAPNISVTGNISNTYNALSSGPITINNNITVTVDNGATWSIV